MASAAVSIAVWNNDRVLLVKRRRPPFRGGWTFPGGRVDAGETSRGAALRELAEETGLTVADARLIRILDTDALKADFAIAVYAARYAGGTPRAKTDAADIGWFGSGDLDGLDTTPGLPEIMEITHAALTQA